MRNQDANISPQEPDVNLLPQEERYVTHFDLANIRLGTRENAAQLVIKNVNSEKVLDVPGGSKDEGVPIIQYTANRGDNQRWVLLAAPNGMYGIVNVNSGKVLDVQEASKNKGALVIQYISHGGTNQFWRFQDAGNRQLVIVNVNSNKVLDVQGASTEDGAAIIQYDNNNGPNQRWTGILI